MAEPVVPSTRDDRAASYDLNQEVEQERLSKPALQAFLNIVACWSIRDEDARALLGNIANIPDYKIESGSLRLLDVDALTRISLLVGIFNALNILYGQKIADGWIQLPNTNCLFLGQSPLTYMIRGGIPEIQSVRRLLDARRS